MRKFLILVCTLVVCSMAGTLKDSRDGKTYKTVQIGNQTWMAENLNYKTSESKCYDNKESNCKRMGRLYTWDAAMDACPDGWSLPDNSDFSELKSFVESKVGEGNAGSVLKGRTFDMSVEGALEYDDRFGFSGQAAGDRIKNAYKFLGETAYLWSSSEGDDSRAFDWVLSSNSDDFFQGNIKFALKKNGFSVRCIKKFASNSKTEEEIRDDRANDSNELDEVSSQRSEAQPSSGTLKDSRDGKTYKTVKIGDQVWMAENLNYKTSESKCYDNKEGNCKKYGRLYTWYDAKKACPAGWRLPSEEDLEILLAIMGFSKGERSLNLRARSWGNGSDKFGFSALPAGYLYSESYFKKFDYLGSYAYFWSSTDSTEYNSNLNLAYYLYINDGVVNDGSAYVRVYDKYYGISVRCLQDSNEGDEVSSLRSEAQPPSGTLKDSRNGKTYKTVKMPDGKTWMAENLNYGTKDSWCYDNDPANCKKYGRLYTWGAAKKACPAGWRLPSKDDLESLLSAVGTYETESSLNLRARSWENGSDKFGFSALPAGGYNKEFYNLGDVTYFWASTERYSYDAYNLGVYDYIAGVNSSGKHSGYSVRCIKKSASNSKIEEEIRDDRANDSNEGDEVSSQRSKAQPSSGTLKDSRDGKTYKTVKIGNQTWMAENLNYKTSESYCYDNKEGNCKKYGRLYTWGAAKKACPAGWHLPSKAEFESLLSAVDFSNRELRARSWANGSDKFGFSALPAGYYSSSKKFVDLGYITYFWASTEDYSDDAYYLYLRELVAGVDDFGKNYGRSVRCLQDFNEGDEVSSQRSEAQPPSGTLKDSRDGKTYKTVKIGDQVWMAENLNYKTRESYCYDNKESNCEKYGRLYTWEAAMNACPAGWRLPSRDVFGRLLDIAGGVLALRARSWINGLDKFGFSALPAGSYDSDREKFRNLGSYTYFWASTEYTSNSAYSLSIDDGIAGVSSDDKDEGNSVRCLQDSNGDKITDARDGKTYETVKMPDGKTWMAENLNYGTKDSWCYDNDPANCKKYGRLYTWEAAKMACPSGWRLPYKWELESLLAAAGSSQDESYQNLRAGSWRNGSDMFGFSALPAGYYSSNDRKFYDLGYNTNFWTSTEDYSNNACRLNFSGNYGAYVYCGGKSNGFSVRCLQD